MSEFEDFTEPKSKEQVQAGTSPSAEEVGITAVQLNERLSKLEEQASILRAQINVLLAQVDSSAEHAKPLDVARQAYLDLARRRNEKMRREMSDAELAVTAAQESNYNALNYLQTQDLETGDGLGESPATIAVREDDIDMLRYLLERGVDMSKQVDCKSDGIYCDPVSIAARFQRLRIIRFFHRDCGYDEALLRHKTLWGAAVSDREKVFSYINDNVKNLRAHLDEIQQRSLLIDALDSADYIPANERGQRTSAFAVYDYLASLGFDTETPIILSQYLFGIGLTPTIHAGLRGNVEGLAHLHNNNVDIKRMLRDEDLILYTEDRVSKGAMCQMPFGEVKGKLLTKLTPGNALEATVFQAFFARNRAYFQTLDAYNYLVSNQGFDPRIYLSSPYVDALKNYHDAFKNDDSKHLYNRVAAAFGWQQRRR